MADLVDLRARTVALGELQRCPARLTQLWVDRARETGATWQDVADAIGCSRRWAIQRYGTRRAKGAR